MLLNSLTDCVEIQLHASQDIEQSHEKLWQSVKVWVAPMLQHVPVVTEAVAWRSTESGSVLLLCSRAGVWHGASAPHPADCRHAPSHHHHRHEIPVLVPQPVSLLFICSEVHMKKTTTDMRYLERHRRAPVYIWAHRVLQSLFNNKIRPLQNSPIQIKPTQLKVDLGLCVTRSVPSAFKSNSWGRPGKSFVCSSSIPVPLLTRAYSFWLYWVPLQKAGAVNPRLEFELVLL